MPRLFDPITVAGCTVPNRIWLAPMCQYSALDGLPQPWHFAHLGARAIGGFGLVCTEATAVVPEGRISPWDTGIWNDAQVDAWRPIVDFIHEQGAIAAIQLAHAGRKASAYPPFPGMPAGGVPDDAGGWEPVGPTDAPFAGLRTPAPLDSSGIARVLAAFTDASYRAAAAGFDAVEIHAAHGYLLHEFYSPLSNTRTDGYGGDLAARIRLTLEAIDAVRAAWPAEKPLLLRISATDWVEGGWDVESSIALAGAAHERGVDLIDVSSGGNALARIPVEPHYQVPFAAAIKERVEVPISAVGLITERAAAQRILDDGHADVVTLARAALRDPNWPLRAAHELGVSADDVRWPTQYLRGQW